MANSRNNRSCLRARLSGRESGFSLPELLIAVAIFSVGMLGIGSMLLASIQNDKLTMTKRRAEDVAMDIAERFKAGNPDLWPESGTRRFVYNSNDPLEDGKTGLKDLSAMLFDWQLYICRGCEYGETQCVKMENGLPAENFSCTARAPGEAQLDTRQIEIWVGWGPKITDPDMDPLRQCTDVETPSAKCRKKRAHIKTYAYEK